VDIMIGRRLPLLAGLVVCAAGCSLVTSFDGYVGDGGGVAATDGGGETGGQGDAGTAGDGATADVQATDVAASDGAQDGGNPSGDGGGTTTEGGGTDASTGPITFVQVTAATPSGAVTTASATFTQAQSASDLIVVVVGWGGAGSVTQVSDSVGNGYATTIAPTHISAGITQVIYYAKGIAAASAGSNTVTVTLSAASTPLDLRAVEYSGLDPVSPYDTSVAFGGRSTTASSGPATTTSARELVFGAGITVGSFTGTGAAFTLRKLTGSGIGVVEDYVVSSTGSYSADAPLASSASYVMQVATFR
jgi:hypothetical protein